MEWLKWEVSQCHSALSCSKFWKVPIFGKVAYNVVYCIIFCGKKLWIAIVQRKFFFCKLCTQSYRSFDAILRFFIFWVFFLIYIIFSKFWKVPIFGKVAYNVVYCIIFCGKKLWIAIVQRKFSFCKLCTQSYRSFDAILRFLIFWGFFLFCFWSYIVFFFMFAHFIFFWFKNFIFSSLSFVFDLILYYIILYYSILYYIFFLILNFHF